MKNHITYALSQIDMNLRDIALARGITPSTISRLRGGLRPSEDVLEKLCNGWPQAATGMNLLVAHLRDEIDRAGHETHNFTLKHTGQKRAAETERILETLRVGMEHDAELYTLLADLRRLIESKHNRDLLRAAEDPETYTTPKKSRKPTTNKGHTK